MPGRPGQTGVCFVYVILNAMQKLCMLDNVWFLLCPTTGTSGGHGVPFTSFGRQSTPPAIWQLHRVGQTPLLDVFKPLVLCCDATVHRLHVCTEMSMAQLYSNLVRFQIFAAQKLS